MMNLLIVLAAKYLFLISILILAVYFLKTKFKKQFAILTLTSFALSFVIAKSSSIFIKDPRPFMVENVKPLIAHTAGNGFPSDHTLLTMAIASIIFTYNKKLGIVLFIIALLVGIARVLAKVHHPVDIAGSIIIATVSTYIAYLVTKRYFKTI